MMSTFELWIESARELDFEDLQRHARIAINNNHSCRDCYVCACAIVYKERLKEKQ